MDWSQLTSLLFDVDGTLVDSGDAHVYSINETMKELHLPSIEKEKVLQLIGSPTSVIYEKTAATSGLREQFDSVFRKKMYQEGGVDLLKPYPNAVEALKSLKAHSFKLAIVTNKRRHTTMLFLDKVGMPSSIFDAFITSEDAKRPKPNPESILRALDVLQAPRELAAMVGDTSMDVAAAREAGIGSIAVRWGFGNPPSDADLLVESVASLPEVFLSNAKSRKDRMRDSLNS